MRKMSKRAKLFLLSTIGILTIPPILMQTSCSNSNYDEWDKRNLIPTDGFDQNFKGNLLYFQLFDVEAQKSVNSVSGLTFNSLTGQISGTPTEEMNAKKFVIKAFHSSIDKELSCSSNEFTITISSSTNVSDNHVIYEDTILFKNSKNSDSSIKFKDNVAIPNILATINQEIKTSDDLTTLIVDSDNKEIKPAFYKVKDEQEATNLLLDPTKYSDNKMKWDLAYYMSQTIVPFMKINTYSIAFITFDRTNDGRIKLLLECDFKLPTGEQLIFYLQTSKDKDHLSENDYSKIAYVQPVEQTKEFSYGLECACSHVVTTEKYEPCQNFLFWSSFITLK